MAWRVEVTDRGIIPARAGFTTPRSGSTVRGPDHPRTRGVYGFCGVCVAVAAGSSPHARGLRPGLRVR